MYCSEYNMYIQYTCAILFIQTGLYSLAIYSIYIEGERGPVSYLLLIVHFQTLILLPVVDRY